MNKRFVPNMYCKRVQDINLEKLKQLNIKCLLIDLDNTMAAHYDKTANDEVLAFIKKVKDAGFKIIIISNNTSDRVTTFASPLNIPFYGQARKPLMRMYLKIIKENDLKKEEIACVGDQLLTDIWGANRLGMFSILVTPIVESDIIYTKLNRLLEVFLFSSLKRTGHLERGKFYD